MSVTEPHIPKEADYQSRQSPPDFGGDGGVHRGGHADIPVVPQVIADISSFMHLIVDLRWALMASEGLHQPAIKLDLQAAHLALLPLSVRYSSSTVLIYASF